VVERVFVVVRQSHIFSKGRGHNPTYLCYGGRGWMREGRYVELDSYKTCLLSMMMGEEISTLPGRGDIFGVYLEALCARRQRSIKCCQML
jgi:hypothetical protein